MYNQNLELYNISNEFTVTEMLSHFDSDFIISAMKDKLENYSYSSIPESNIISSFEENFKIMREKFPGDGININTVRDNVYRSIIDTLCEFYNLQFNYDDDNIDYYTAAYYLYDILLCNYSKIMINFFTSFIINNKDSLYSTLSSTIKKVKDASYIYGKKMYIDSKYILITSNLEKAISYISNLDITFFNIIQSTYTDPRVVQYIDSIVGDKGNFFKNYYCSILNKPDVLPIILTDLNLNLLQYIGNGNNDILNYINSANKED